MGTVEEALVRSGVEADGIEATLGKPGKLDDGIEFCIRGERPEGDAFQEDAIIAEGKKAAIDPQAHWSGRGHARD